MTKIEIHARPMILPHLNGTPNAVNKCEVDVWLYLRDGVAEIIFEAVADSQEAGIKLVEDLKEAFGQAQVIVEESKSFYEHSLK